MIIGHMTRIKGTFLILVTEKGKEFNPWRFLCWWYDMMIMMMIMMR